MAANASKNVAKRSRDALLAKLDKEILEACVEGRERLMDELLDRRLQIMASRREQDEANAA